MPAMGPNMLGLIELTDAEDLALAHGLGSSEVLQNACVERLKGWVRKSDQWQVLPNNRFCVLLNGLHNPAQLELATAKLARLFDEPYNHHGQPIAMEVAAGFAATEDSTGSNDVAIRQAGVALIRAKAASHLFEIYNPQSESSASDERDLIRRLEAAVELGQLELYFQPKIHAGYRSLIGAEALIRWHTEKQVVVTPDQFIEVAERHEVIRPMTWWTIKSAISRLSHWPEELSIAVNITPTLLLDDEILSVVRDSLDIHSVEARRLTLEVTENVMIDNQQTVLPQLARLRKMGVRVSIDDFGTGFSSLAYFRHLPVDEIKIDKSFVIPMLESVKDHAIVKAVIDLAHNFSLRVVAEGVETEEIAQRLAKLRCDVLQGYFFDRPLLIQDFETRYLRR